MLGATTAVVSPEHALYAQWRARSRWQMWPRAGGWEDQPLASIVAMDALDIAERVRRFTLTPNADWNKLSPLEMDLIRWLENDHE